jgi:hypothetical protein
MLRRFLAVRLWADTPERVPPLIDRGLLPYLAAKDGTGLKKLDQSTKALTLASSLPKPITIPFS